MDMPGNPRVLYAEDNDDCSSMVRFMLESSGINVTVANTASDALHLAEIESFDLYLLDSKLPDQSGLELCGRLRTLSPHTPILFYSALAFTSDIQSGLAAGANDYLVKPYAGDLAQTILQVIQNFRSFEGEFVAAPLADELGPPLSAVYAEIFSGSTAIKESRNR